MATNKNIKINLDYSNFTGGIKECQSKIQILNNEFKLQTAMMGESASATDKLSLQSQILTQKISLQEQVVNQAIERWEAMCNSEESTIQQVEAAHKAYQKQATVLAEMRNELNSTNEALEENATAEEEAVTATEAGSQGFLEYASNITSTISVITQLIEVVVEVGSAIAETASQTTEWADDLQTTAAQIGISTTTLQEWGYAADFVDVSVETMQSSMVKLTKNMGEVESGSASAKAKFDALGVSVTQRNGELKSSEQVFYECIDALHGIDNQAERDAAAMEVFGRSATELNTLIEAGSGALQSYGEEAQSLGVIMSSSDVEALSSMNDSFDRLSQVMDAATNRLGAAFAPAISSVANAIANLDPSVLTIIASMGLAYEVVQKATSAFSSMATILTLTRTAKIATTIATTAETTAETGLATAAAVTDAALLPQIAIAVALLAAFTLLIVGIKELIEMFTEEADAADKAAESTQKFNSAAKSSSSSSSSASSSASSGTEHHASGGWTRNSQVWVGEQGAELVDLPVGSYVHNSTDSRNMSSTSNVFNVTIDAKNVSDFNQVVKVFSGLSQSMNRGSKVNG